MEDNFVSPEGWRNWANVENRALAVKLARYGFPWKQSDNSMTMTGASQYSFTEPLAIVAFFFVESDLSYRKLAVCNPVQNQGVPNRAIGNPEEFNIYRNTEDQITVSFFPNPASGSVIRRQVDHPAELVYSSPGANQSLSVTYPLNWEELIVLKMARRALAKEGTENFLIERSISEMESDICDGCTNFLLTDNPVVRNVRYDNATIDYTNWLFI